MKKYILCALPMLLCIEIVSYACLCALTFFFFIDLNIVGREA